jgi:hypothetical protein
MPGMELAPTLTEWILAALVGPSDETVERDRHVAGGVRHRRPLRLVCDLQVATTPLGLPPSHGIVKPPGPATPGFRAKWQPGRLVRKRHSTRLAILGAVGRRGSREERVAGLIRVGELELTGDDEAEVDAYFAPDFVFHGPDGAELDYEGLKAFFA